MHLFPASSQVQSLHLTHVHHMRNKCSSPACLGVWDVFAPRPFRTLKHIRVSVVSGQAPPPPTLLVPAACSINGILAIICAREHLKYRVSIEPGVLTIAAALQFGANPLFT